MEHMHTGNFFFFTPKETEVNQPTQLELILIFWVQEAFGSSATLYGCRLDCDNINFSL